MAEETTKGRTLPHNLEAEKSVLGAVLLDNQAVNAAAELLTGDDFYGEAHRLIFAAMCALSEVGAPIDAVTSSSAPVVPSTCRCWSTACRAPSTWRSTPASSRTRPRCAT
jgi:hypothetical protein